VFHQYETAMKLKDILNEVHFVKYLEMTIMGPTGKKIGVYYTDMNKTTTVELANWARSMTPKSVLSDPKYYNAGYSVHMQKGTDTPSGKYVKPSIIKKASKEVVRKAKEYNKK